MQKLPRLVSLALVLLAIQLTVALPRAFLRSTHEGRSLILHRKETPFQQRVRTFGPGYVEAIEQIRRTIPADGAYLLINGHGGVEEGGPLWVKFDLAPRRAVYVGMLEDLRDADRLRRRTPRAARWVVIARGAYEPPVLVERYRFMRQLGERSGG